jgi:hypothetical protein
MTIMETEKETTTRRFNKVLIIGLGHIVSGIDNFARLANVLWAR